MMIKHSELAEICLKASTHHSAEVAELEYLIEDQEDQTILSIRSTEANGFLHNGGWRDILRDLRILPTKHPSAGWGHSGFLKGADRVAKSLKGLISKDKPLILCGHSLGGAIASALVPILCNHGYLVAGCVSFGAPRVFIGGRKYCVEMVHYRYGKDIVCCLPPTWLGFRRCGVTVEVGTVGNPFPNFSDHSIKKYIRAIRAVERETL